MNRRVEGVGDVFVLQHVYSVDDCEEVKMIGVYESAEEAEEAAARLRGMPGFRDRPRGFQVERYPLNVDHWTEGFLSD
jgi:hypothetical protein